MEEHFNYVRKSSIVSIAYMYTQFFNCITSDSGRVVYTQVDSEVYIDAYNFAISVADYGGAICVDFIGPNQRLLIASSLTM